MKRLLRRWRRRTKNTLKLILDRLPKTLTSTGIYHFPDFYTIFTHVTLLDTSMRDPLFSFPVSVCFALPISNLYCVLGIFNFDSPVIPLLLIAFVIGGPLIFHPSPNLEATSIKWKRFLVWGEQDKERTTTIITTQLHEN